MRELRHDPLRRRWVIVSTERSRRPSDYLGGRDREPPLAGECFFCAGHEEETPAELWALRPDGTPPDGPGWQVRVVPNKYPALRRDLRPARRAEGPWDMIEGYGAHEVVVESPDHGADLADAAPPAVQRVLVAYRERMRVMYADPAVRYVQVFRNHRVEAGASVRHPHSQLIATPIIPETLEAEYHTTANHYLLKERCLLCDMLAYERAVGRRLVADYGDFVVLAPYASGAPYELLILPALHHSDFTAADDAAMSRLARVLGDTLGRLKRLLSDPPYNYFLHTGPPPGSGPRPGYWEHLPHAFHWHLELVPRLGVWGGFEWGTAIPINQTSPEEAAEQLREGGKENG